MSGDTSDTGLHLERSGRLEVSIRKAAWILWGMAVVMVIGFSLFPPSVTMALAFVTSDKLTHCGTYYLLAIIPAVLLSNPWQRFRSTLGVIGFGAVLEYLQYFVAGRSAEWFDAAASIAGAALAWITAQVLLIHRELTGGFLRRGNRGRDK